MTYNVEKFQEHLAGLWQNEFFAYNFQPIPQWQHRGTVYEKDHTSTQFVTREYSLDGNVLQIGDLRYEILSLSDTELTIRSISPIDTFIGQTTLLQRLRAET